MAKKLSVPSPSEDTWRARDDLRTLTAAAEIQADKSRLGQAKREANKQISAISRVAGGSERSSAKRSGPSSLSQKLKNKRI